VCIYTHTHTHTKTNKQTDRQTQTDTQTDLKDEWNTDETKQAERTDSNVMKTRAGKWRQKTPPPKPRLFGVVTEEEGTDRTAEKE